MWGGVDRPGRRARTRTRRLGSLGHVLEAVRRADGCAIGHVEGVEGAFEILVVVVLVRLAILHGEQCVG